MAKKQFLSATVLKKLQKELENKRDRLTGNVEKLEKESLMNSQKEASGELSGWKSHMADSGNDANGMELMLGLARNQERLLNQVMAALKRIEDGSYGYCTNCGKAIAQARLEAIPEAEFCINCADL